MAQPEVRVHGELRRIVWEHRWEGVAALSDAVPGPHTWALGPLEGLAGEVTVLDDAIWIARPGPGPTATLECVRRSDARAAMLVDARVERWSEIALPENLDLAALERELPAFARESGLDPGRPFPFRIEGRLARVAFHVVDGAHIVDTGAGHEDHLRAARRFEHTDVEGSVLGFHSASHQGVFTHHGNTTHMHVVLPAARESGHVDELVVAAGARLCLPR